jgi:hypothetical protein
MGRFETARALQERADAVRAIADGMDHDSYREFLGIVAREFEMKAKSAGYRATYRAKQNGKESAEPHSERQTAEPVSAPAEQCISDISIRGEFLDCDGPERVKNCRQFAAEADGLAAAAANPATGAAYLELRGSGTNSRAIWSARCPRPAAV